MGISFADAAKCVAIREGLRRRARRDLGKQLALAVSWRAAPPDHRSLFEARQHASQSSGPHRAVRGQRKLVRVDSEQTAESITEFPGEIDEAKREFCQSVDRAAVKRLLPDRSTVLVVFFFDGDDLVVLPIRKDAGDEPQILHISEGYFRVCGVLPKVRRLEHKQEGHVLAIQDEELGLCGLPADELRREADMSPIYKELYELLDLKGLLKLLRESAAPTPLDKLHLVLIPDGPLYRLALHAAFATLSAPRLYKQFASLRYGLSLRTLELQQQIQDGRAQAEAEDRTLRGVAFANPDRDERIGLIEGVIREMQVLVEETSAATWWLHGELKPRDQQAVRVNLRERHQAGNIGWTMGHGVDVETAHILAQELGLKDDFALPDGRQVPAEESLLLCDGLLSMSRMLGEGYDFSNWRLFHISACLLGRLRELGASKEVLGYIAVLTLLGCRRVSSALWPLSDEAAPEFARFWIRAIKRHVFGPEPAAPHAFAIAFKEALDNFRMADNGRFDHEFFWAPYTLYGLG
ncbi:MAG: CHAT domain-containing protein [Gemmataceae bacterium]|nr:CHAT domain-containing protein [Gemmataceae bacterium]